MDDLTFLSGVLMKIGCSDLLLWILDRSSIWLSSVERVHEEDIPKTAFRTRNGIHVDPSKIEAVKIWKVPKTPYGILLFLGLAEWAKEQEEAFQKLKGNLLCTHAKRQGRERDSRNAAWPGPTNGKEGRWRLLRDMDQLIKMKEDGGMNFIWVPLIDDVRTLILDEAHASRYLVHSGTDKTYYDLRGLLQQPEIPEWKWDKIIMDFITKLPKTKSGHDTIG
ncbi:hypothetical protein Tco_0775554 [Tanacetum coccineum]